MSALTKVFVVLHVIVSLLLVAGMVVFVNKVEDWGATARKAQDDLKSEKQARLAVDAKLLQVQGEAAKAIGEATDRSNVLAAANTQLQGQVTSLEGQLVAARNDKEGVTTQLTTATNALKVAQDANLAQEKVTNDLRNQNEDLDKKYTQSQVALSDLNNRLDAANTELRYSKEQIAALTTELQAARDRMATAPNGARPAPSTPGAPGTPPGGTPAPGPSTGGPAAPVSPSNVSVRGVVKNTFRVGDVQYATVGLGSADGVTKGTRFNVVDPAGTQFLGYLTVDTVEPNEASGHLSGPKVPSIQKGSSVMTNFQ